MDELNRLDFLALAVLVLSMATAFWKGISRELISLAGAVVGFLLAVFFYTETTPYFSPYVSDVAAPFLGFMSIFGGVLIGAALLVFLIRRLLSALHLLWIDRLLGGVFGLVRGWLIVTVLFLALTAFPVSSRLVEQSALAEFFVTSARALVFLAPQEFESRFLSGYEKLYQFWITESYGER